MRRSLPAASRKSTDAIEAPISYSCQPAFMTTAPPIVPGIPAPNSNPDNPARAAARATAGNDAPAPADTVAPSIATPSRTRRTRSTRPRTPASRTRRLEPLPSVRQGRPCSAAQATATTRSSRFAGVARISAGPPMRQVVSGPSGASASTEPRNPAFTSEAEIPVFLALCITWRIPPRKNATAAGSCPMPMSIRQTDLSRVCGGNSAKPTAYISSGSGSPAVRGWN